MTSSIQPYVEQMRSSRQTFFLLFFSLLFFTFFVTIVSPAQARLHPRPSTPDDASPAAPSWATYFQLIGFEIPRELFPLSVVFVGAPVDDLTEDQIEAAVEAAIAAWNDIPCSYAQMEWAGFRSTLDEVSDEEIPIYFRPGDDGPTTSIAWTIYGASAQIATDSQVVLNYGDYFWSSTAHPFDLPHLTDRPIVDLPSVLAHELGHVLGLGHTTAHNVATMAPHYLRDGSQIELSADDKLGLCELYPTAGVECDDDTHCAPGASCVGHEEVRVCDIHFGEIGDYCGFELQNCPHFCHLDEPEIGVGYCSSGCADDADCPAHFSCLTPPEYSSSVCQFDPAPPEEADPSCSSTKQSPIPILLLAFALVAAARLRP